MKTVFVFVCFLILIGCSSGKKELEEFIPGLYVREVTHEYSTGKDTLIIMHLKHRVYLIDRTGTFQRIRDGHFLSPEEKKESWSAFFDAKTGVLIETKRGRIISFDKAQNRLLVGSSPYQKK